MSFNLMGMEINTLKFIIGTILMIISAVVILGGIQRIGTWAGKMVPLMIVLYFVSVMGIIAVNIDQVPHYFALIFSDAFSPQFYDVMLNDKGQPCNPLVAGVFGGLVMLGVRRASFSNEAGIGTAPMALGASQSKEPIREGLVSMMSPLIDTLVVCTLTGLAILVTGVWQDPIANCSPQGATLTAQAFNSAFPGFGKYVLLLCAFFFAITSLFSYSYYGNKALSFLIGVKPAKYYDYFYLATIIVGAVASMTDVMNVIDIAYALMAFPTMLSGFVLAPKVMTEAKAYFKRLDTERAAGK